MRRNLFRAGVGVTTAVATKILTHRAQAQTATPVPSTARGCFLTGTRIRTIEGEKAIEEPQIDERLVVSLAGTAPVASIVRWRGAVTPIRITVGAIEEHLPYADLVVTEHHAILFSGSLIAVGNLVNGTTIVRGPRQEAEFFNIRLAGHDVVYAQGVPCETLYSEADGEPCLPRYCYRGRRHEVASYLRSAFSPVVDLRNRADLIRDGLDLAA